MQVWFCRRVGGLAPTVLSDLQALLGQNGQDGLSARLRVVRAQLIDSANANKVSQLTHSRNTSMS